MTDDLVARLKDCQRDRHTQWSDLQLAIDALGSQAAAIRQKDEQIARLTKERDGWTPEPPKIHHG